jgi:hypothetical protein
MIIFISKILNKEKSLFRGGFFSYNKRHRRINQTFKFKSGM